MKKVEEVIQLLESCGCESRANKSSQRIIEEVMNLLDNDFDIKSKLIKGNPRVIGLKLEKELSEEEQLLILEALEKLVFQPIYFKENDILVIEKSL